MLSCESEEGHKGRRVAADLTMSRVTFRHLVLVVVIFSCSVGMLSGCFSNAQAPTAVILKSPSICYPLMPIEFDARASSGGRSEIGESHWRFSDGSSKIGSVIEHKFQSPGAHTVQLQITTEDGRIATASREVAVLDALVVPGSFSRIQEAIDAAVDGDAVVILPGEYVENIDFLGKQITVQSTDPNDPSIVDATMLRPPDLDRSIVSFVNGETRDSVLAGLTLQGGHRYEPYSGGGIYVREASPTIRNNNIRDLTVFFSGGGIYLVESRAHIVGNRISNNRSQNGGGIEAEGYYYFPTIEGNVFVNNRAEVGGAVHLSSTLPLQEPPTALPTTVGDNVFNSNVATTPRAGGGAVYIMYDCKLFLGAPDGNTYSGNTPDDIYYEVPPSE